MEQKQKIIFDEGTVEAACVHAFAMVVASISHEVKNVLAIINENGGLLEDIIMLGEPGQGVPPEHVQSATATIGNQVQRASRIMKDCNRLAHLNDKPVTQEPLVEILELMAALARRQADMKNMTLSAQCPPDIRIAAPMLPFASLVYLLLLGIINAGPNDTAISLSAATVQDAITLKCEADLSETAFADIVDDDKITALIARFGGLLHVKGGMVEIKLASEISY